VTPNEDEFQKSAQNKFRYCPGVSEYTLLAEDIKFEIGHIRNFWTSLTLTFDRVIRNIPSCSTHRHLPT